MFLVHLQTAEGLLFSEMHLVYALQHLCIGRTFRNNAELNSPKSKNKHIPTEEPTVRDQGASPFVRDYPPPQSKAPRRR